MIPKRIELDNFLSFGTPAVEFVFTDDEPLWALCGQNGVGKSAVFDGITYALYGEHRGGSQKAEQLVRHGANGFRIVFEFEFAGVEYRITRVRAGRTSQKVERRSDAEWEAIPGLNTAADVKAWVERTLGLGYKAFTTSVLLRQGEADKLFSASRDERIALLKGIVGFERFEEVSGRVHSAALCRSSDIDSVRRQLATVAPVGQEELQGSDEAVTEAERFREESQARFTAAVQRVEWARRWETLEAKRVELEGQLAAAEERAADAESICNAKVRLDELAEAVPVLAELVALHSTIAELEPKVDKAAVARNGLASAIDLVAKAIEAAQTTKVEHKALADEADRLAKALEAEIERGKKLLELADALQKVNERLSAFPSDLAAQIAQAERDEAASAQTKQDASSAVAGATALLEQARKQRQRFADIKIGATCSQCGQKVDEHHARKEAARLDREIEDREAEVSRLEAAATASEADAAAARERRLSLQRQQEQYVKCAAELSATSASLAQFGEAADPATLRARLSGRGGEKLAAEARASDERQKLAQVTSELARLGEERERLDRELQAEAETVRTMEIALASSRATYNSGLHRLTDKWRAELLGLDAEGVCSLADERDRLQGSGVSEKYEQLRQDSKKRSEWSAQLEDVRRQVETLPEDGRVLVKEAERLRDLSKAELDRAGSDRDGKVRTRDGLKARAEQHATLTARLRDAERQLDLHKKLDDLLGQNGLQRELVRDAEQQIVELANDTLQNLSDGNLSLEQDDEVAGRDDKAFALRVRKANDPWPIGVQFLSGSQKFRVAVSVALAVGRFACGRARPLEAVVIDEGFGSLDKDGLRAMADELKRLQRTQALKRVILVSHQEDFTDQFPVGYRLTSGSDGTKASPFRR